MQLYTGSDWNAVIRHLGGAHILQTHEWGDFKRRTTGWMPEHYLWRDAQGEVCAAALILTRQISLFRVMYAPKGPLLNHMDLMLWQRVLADLESLARRRRAIYLKIDPDVIVARGVPNTPESQDDQHGQAILALLKQHRWQFSDSQVQFRNTVALDLRQSEEDLLAGMNQSKRRKVRYGEKHGVQIRPATLDDLPVMYRMYAETGRRNGFITRPEAYYLDEWGTMLRSGLGHALIAEVGGVPCAHVVLFAFGQKCLYFIGASVSDNDIRKLMPADGLQWAAIQWAKAQGYLIYDLWGAPNDFVETDPLWGVWQFKKDFGGQVIRHIGAWDFTPLPPLYALYTRLMPRFLAWLRRRNQLGNA